MSRFTVDDWALIFLDEAGEVLGVQLRMDKDLTHYFTAWGNPKAHQLPARLCKCFINGKGHLHPFDLEGD